MAGRSPLRFLAPVALVAFAVVLYTVVDDARAPRGGSAAESPAHSSTPAAKGASAKKKSSRHKRRMYTVKAGDTASGIAEKTGVSLATLQKLNKNLDPQTLSPGQRLRLSE
jgi:LysM repeat protein